MADSEAYRRRAEECAELAANATPANRPVWLELEQQWLRLAQELELYDRIDPFAAFVRTHAGRSRAH